MNFEESLLSVPKEVYLVSRLRQLQIASLILTRYHINRPLFDSMLEGMWKRTVKYSSHCPVAVVDRSRGEIITATRMGNENHL